MEAALRFRRQIASESTCLGTCITFGDATVSEALTGVLDFLWIDAEHNPLSLADVQAHVMATKGTATTPLVRVPANDAVLIKPVLDLGAAGVIVPLVRTADDVRRAVAACHYPPEGIRGFGPRRAAQFGKQSGPEFCRAANESVITIVQIEQAEAVTNLREILAVPGLTSIVVGPNDLAASLGYTGQPRHAEVLATIDSILAAGRAAKVPVGLAVGDDVEAIKHWIERGAAWIAISADFALLARYAEQLVGQVRAHEAERR